MPAVTRAGLGRAGRGARSSPHFSCVGGRSPAVTCCLPGCTQHEAGIGTGTQEPGAQSRRVGRPERYLSHAPGNVQGAHKWKRLSQDMGRQNQTERDSGDPGTLPGLTLPPSARTPWCASQVRRTSRAQRLSCRAPGPAPCRVLCCPSQPWPGPRPFPWSPVALVTSHTAPGHCLVPRISLFPSAPQEAGNLGCPCAGQPPGGAGLGRTQPQPRQHRAPPENHVQSLRPGNDPRGEQAARRPGVGKWLGHRGHRPVTQTVQCGPKEVYCPRPGLPPLPTPNNYKSKKNACVPGSPAFQKNVIIYAEMAQSKGSWRPQPIFFQMVSEAVSTPAPKMVSVCHVGVPK